MGLWGLAALDWGAAWQAVGLCAAVAVILLSWSAPGSAMDGFGPVRCGVSGLSAGLGTTDQRLGRSGGERTESSHPENGILLSAV
ncbi:MAG: hypothetical protein ACLU9S_22990 [Oscillospiraceae bacterium]